MRLFNNIATAKESIISLIGKVTSWKTAATVKASNLREVNLTVLFTPDYVMPRPFKSLPNISEFNVRTTRLDPLLDRAGIARMLAPELSSKELSSKIKSANRYIWVIQNRLERLLRANRTNEFWAFALMLMRRSKVLRVVALRKLNPNWHREYKLSKVKMMLTQLDTTIWSVRTALKIVRDYVEKVKPSGEVTYRPIGAPSYVDRMYTYLFQSFVVMYSEAFVSKSQHAYFPKRGVVTAVQELKTLLADNNQRYPYVWEFDLKGAFPSVVIPEAMKVLRDMNIPGPLVEVFERICVTSVERVDKAPHERYRLLEEPKFDKQELLADALPFIQPGEYDWVESRLIHAAIDWFRARKEILDKISDPVMRFHQHWAMQLVDWAQAGEEQHRVQSNKYMDEMYKNAMDPRYVMKEPKLDHELFPALVEYRKILWERHLDQQKKAALDRARAASDLAAHGEMLARKGKDFSPPIEVRGFPQGLGLSPIFFDICFEAAALRGHFEKLGKDVRVVSYADDFLVFSSTDLGNIFDDSKNMKTMGLALNLEKSRCLKMHGAWVEKSFKFLGISFMLRPDGLIDIIGSPRSGKELFFDKLEAVEDFVQRDLDLKRIADFLGAKVSSQQVLDMWGQGVVPFSNIPWAIMKGERRLTTEDLLRLKGTDDSYEFPGNFTESEKTLVSKHLRGSPLNAMGTRLAGLLISRLHGGSWDPAPPKVNPDHEVGGRDLRSSPSAKGVSWMDRIQNACVNLRGTSQAAMRRVAARLEAYEARNRSLSIYNSTSHATLDLLRMQRNRKYMKLTKRGLVYR